MIWLGQIVQGVLLGGYYALLACGLSFMFGVMGIINLAHGSLAVVAAFLIWIAAEHAGIHPFVALLGAVPAMGALGWLLQRVVLDRSVRSGVLVPILSTFGLAVLIDNSLFAGFGADTRSLAPYIDTLAFDSWELLPNFFVGQLALLILVVAVVLLGGLHALLRVTALGRRIRAVAEDPDTAQLVGVNAPAVYAIAAAISMMTVAVAGAALAVRSTFDPYTGPQQLIFAFEAVVIGGAGSLWGTLVGGITLGVAQSLGAQINPQGFLIAGHAVFLGVLVVRQRIGSDVLALIRSWRARPT
ncbi:ABC transporter permease [Burkholderiales bacterium]|jgi:branched-chain amino acid transport system permease protein|nr:ABC transporter permease [Burkholderiales bacterium]